MDALQYDEVNRKLSIYDIELGAKDLVLRLDLDLNLSKFTPPPKVPDMVSATGKSEGPGGSVGRNSKMEGKVSDVASNISVSPLGEEENYWRTRQIRDMGPIKRILPELRMCMERMVNRVFIIGNLGERNGRQQGENSMKIVYNEL
jgi:hypothetical protein